MQNLMLDIETLGTTPGCIVLSIGAVEFDEHEITGEFHTHIDVKSSHKAGLTVEPSTVMWWLDRSKEAQNALLQAETVSLEDALDALIDTFEWKNKRIWANGASFDFPILDAAFAATERVAPWPYYAQMDYRTLKGLVEKDVYTALKVEPTIAHDALADARAQALTTIQILNFIRGVRGYGVRTAA